MAAMRLSYKHLLLCCIALGILYVWMSLHFSSTVANPQTPSSYSYTDDEDSVVPARSDCGIMLPFLDASSINFAMCKLKLPLADSCRIANKIFSESTVGCSQKDTVMYCKLKGEKVECDPRTCRVGINIGYRNTNTGHLVWANFSSWKAVTQAIEGLLHADGNSRYVLIRCRSSVSPSRQLLVLPPLPAPRSSGPHDDTRISINTLFIDSVSFFHFHRSLPQTVQTLQDVSATSVKVLSYPLFQSIKSRTFENLQALFSGEVDIEQDFGILSMPEAPLKLEHLLKPLEDKGYDNLVQEDLCWHWEWGFSKDLLVHNKSISKTEYWQRLQAAFKKASITSYGISPSSCEILELTGKPDPFHGVPAVCYNGDYQHSYIFDYLNKFQQLRAKSGSPYFSFYGCNVPHDEWGTRVKTLDDGLSKLVADSSKLQKTLTILISDHGNSYGQFGQFHQQGRDEVYHPLLYIVIPKGVQQLLGREVMRNLELNQHRLVTMLDVHHLLKYIAAPSSNLSGIVSPLPLDRQCSSLPLFQPNICICLKTEQETLPHSDLALLAEYASGQLTNKLAEAISGQQMKCNVLLPLNYTNVHITSRMVGEYMVSMTINFPSPHKDYIESFLVGILYSPVKFSSTFVKLLAFERRSTYSVYRGCGDGPSTESLCICQPTVYFYNIASNWLSDSTSKGLLTNRRESQRLNSCIYLVWNHVSNEGRSLYSLNVCSGVTYSLSVEVIEEEAIFYSTIPSEGWRLKPLSVQFILIAKFLGKPEKDAVFHFSSVAI
ncbi:uncharacterized protein [Watersipora subatra]|uniref:uncharacterized protein n=1 Tax=Watersipora subatra TaxID=2589382 RepID=UPI00355C4791